MANVGYTTVKVTINGQSEVLKIKKDLAWGELIEILQHLGGFGADNLNMSDMMEFLHVLLEKALYDREVIDPRDRTAFLKLSAREVTVIIGEVLKRLPLEQYIKNMGINLADVEDTQEKLVSTARKTLKS